MAEAVEVVRLKQSNGQWLLDRIHPGAVFFDLERCETPSRWNTLRTLQVRDWWNRTMSWKPPPTAGR